VNSVRLVEDVMTSLLRNVLAELEVIVVVVGEEMVVFVG
jgi:hypothetical protein